MSDWLERVEKIDHKKHFESLVQKRREAFDEWYDLFDCEVMRDMLTDLQETSPMFAPNIWGIQILTAISGILQGFYKEYNGGNLNIYSLAIAGSGVGKDSGRKYFKAIFAELGLEGLFLGDFLKSNLSLERPLKKRKDNACGIAMVDEIGSLLVKMSGDKCPDYLETLDGLILSAYSSREYKLPASSETDEILLKNLHFVISGTSAMSKLIDGVTFATIESGRMNRFFIVEEMGGRCVNPYQKRPEAEFSQNVIKRFEDISEHVNKLKNGFFTGSNRQPIKFMKVYCSPEDRQYIKDLDAKITVDMEIEKVQCISAYARLIETAIRLTCIYAIFKAHERPVFDLKFFKAILCKARQGFDLLLEIAINNKNKNLKETSDEAKTRLFNAIVDLFKNNKGMAKLGGKAGQIKQKILKAPKTYGYTPETYPDSIVMSVIGKIAYNAIGFRKEGEGNKTTLFYDMEEVANEKILNEIKADIINEKEAAIDGDSMQRYQAALDIEKQLDNLSKGIEKKKEEEPQADVCDVSDITHFITRTG